MKKMYVQPALDIHKVETFKVVAASIVVGGETENNEDGSIKDAPEDIWDF